MMSLRIKFLIPILFATLLLFGITAYFFYSFSSNFNEQRRVYIQYQKEKVKSSFVEMIDTAKNLSDTISINRLVLDGLSVNDQYETLDTISAYLNLTDVDLITIYFSDGEIFAQAYDFSNFGTKDELETWIKQLADQKAERVELSQVNQKWYLLSGQVINTLNGVNGVVVVGYDLQKFVHQFRENKNQGLNIFYQNELILKQEETAYLSEHHHPEGVIRHIYREHIHFDEEFGRDSSFSITIFEDYHAEADQFWQEVWIFVLLILIFSLIFILTVIKFIGNTAASITNLSNRALEIAPREDLSSDKHEHHDEIELLKDAFSYMVDQLQTTQNELKTYANDLEQKNITLSEMDKQKDELIERLELLSEIGEMLAGLRNPLEVLNTVLMVMKTQSHLERGSVYLYNKESQFLEVEVVEPSEDGLPTARYFQVGEGVAGKSVEKKEIIFIPDTSQDLRFIDNQEEAKALLCIPLLDDNDVFGVMNFVGQVDQVIFSEEDFDFASTLARITVITTKNFQMLEVIEEQKNTLEQKVIDRTSELSQSNKKLEDQNTMLAASNRKLEDLNSTKDHLLHQLGTLEKNHLTTLKMIQEKLFKTVTGESKTLVRQLGHEIHEVDGIIQPITFRYMSEKAIKSKRVLLAETSKKQQILVKMALGGTGVDLDIVSTLAQGKERLANRHYEVIFMNSELIELASIVHERSPDTQTVFLTSDDAVDYLKTLKQYDFISNIVSRHDEDRSFTLKNITTTVSKLINHDLYGLEKYLNWGVEVHSHPITCSYNRDDLVHKMTDSFQQQGVRRNIINKCAMVAEEILMNAIYDAPVDGNNHPLYNHLSRTVDIDLKAQEQGQFCYACDGLFLAVSAIDPFGGLDRQTVFAYLESCYAGNAGTLNAHKGGAGRGLFQIIETSDLFVINVNPGIKTEVISIFNIDPNKSKHENSTSFHYFYE